MGTRHLLRKIRVGVVLISSLFFSSGCIYLVAGGAGVLGGYVISPDTVEGIIGGRDMEEVWHAAVEVISVMGVIEERNDAGGMLISKIQGNRVTVTVMQVSNQTIKLRVKARKAFLPRIRTAQEVYMKIEKYLYE